MLQRLAIERIRNEIKMFNRDPPENCSLEEQNDSYFHYHATIIGPEGSPYQNGIFLVDIKFPDSYPYNPPVCIFQTRIYHPNIAKCGYYCLDKFKSYIWEPSFNIRQILLETYTLLKEPDVENNVLEIEIANLYKNDKKKFEKIAKEWTNRYAYRLL